MGSRRAPGPPLRHVTSKALRREVLVFTEGSKTEVQYLTHWFRLHRDKVLVTIDGFHGGPLQLVQHAIERRRKDAKAEKRGEGRAPTQTWCMFDIDEHPHVNRAIQTAADNGIGIAVSNPCLELWYLLHFREQTGWIERHAAQSDVATFITKGKSLSTGDLDRLIALFPQARGRAKHLATLHEANGNPPGDNPSSTVWTLVDCIRTSST